MSKRNRSFPSSDELSNDFSLPPTGSDPAPELGSVPLSLGKEVRIGLGIIVVLLIVLTLVFVRRVRGPGEDVASTAESSVEPTVPADSGQTTDSTIRLPGQPTVISATADANVIPASGTLQVWSGSDATATAPPQTAAASPPSFMPKLVSDAPSPRYAGYGGQDTTGSAAMSWQPSDAGSATVETDPSTVPATQFPASFAPQTQAESADTGEALVVASDETNPLRLPPTVAEISTEPALPPSTATAPVYDAGSAPRYDSSDSSATKLPAASLPAYSGDPGSGEPDSPRSTYRALATTSAPAQATINHAALGGGNSVAEAVARNKGSYTILPGDSYWTISEKLYGTGGYFRALAEHNREKFPRENQLLVGETIAAPSAEQLTANYPSLCPKPGHREIAAERARILNTSTRVAGGRTYSVQEGDNLFDIAKFELGKAARWVEIYELNREVLGKQLDYLTPGMQLVLPDDRPSGTITERPGQSYQR